MPKAIIVYGTVGGSTKTMANTIRDEMSKSGIDVISKTADDTKVDELRDFDAIILGSPTYKAELMYSMKAFLSEMQRADLKGKIGAAFGSYGWSGEAVQKMTDAMKHVFGMNVIEPGLKLKINDLYELKDFGIKIANTMKQSVTV
jgi:flavodoxin I